MGTGESQGEEYGDAYPVEIQWRRPRRVTAADRRPRVVALPGDGIGPEIIAAARRVLDAVGELEVTEHLVGGASIDEHGTALTDEVLAACAAADAVLLGAVGGPKWETTDPDAPRPEQGLLGLRKGLGLYANLRPIRPSATLAHASPLREERIRGTDLLVVRELTGGIYFGARGPRDGEAHDTCVYSSAEIERIARMAFEAARARSGGGSARGRRRGGSSRVTSVDKANVLETSRLWRETVDRVAPDYAEVGLEHMLVDNAAMQLVSEPARFDVILTENMFGDILSDEAAMLTGSLGMLPSASLGKDGPGLFEPVHGSAPEIAGTGTANPLATFLSVALMLRYGLDRHREAVLIETAVESVLERGLRTRDLGWVEPEQPPMSDLPAEVEVGTQEMTDAVIDELGR
jgi:3-isopropylmalate dehydrogenase